MTLVKGRMVFLRTSLPCFLAAAFGAAAARAETNVWVGLGSTLNWSASENWTNGVVPLGAGDLTIQLSGTNNLGNTTAPQNQNLADPLTLNRLWVQDVAGNPDKPVFLAGGALAFVANGPAQPTLFHDRDQQLYLRTPLILPAATTLVINNRTYGIDFEAPITGEGGFSFGSGSLGGEMSLKTTNSYSGGTAYINTSGANAQYTRLYVYVTNALGAGPVTLRGGNLNPLSAGNTQAGGLTFRGTSAHTNAFSLDGSSPIYAGDGITNETVAAASVVLRGPFNLNTNTLYLRGQRNTSGTISGAISGTGPYAITKMDLGPWTLTGDNTFTGRVTVSNGTLKLGAVNAVPATAPVTVSGGVYDLNGLAATNGSLTISSGAISNGTLSVGAVSATDGGFVRATLAGDAGLTKSGAGTLTLTAPNLYSGATTVNAGLLHLAQRSALYNADTAQWTESKIIVNSGATLGLSVGGSGEFTDSDIGLLAGLGSAAGGFKAGALLGLDTASAPGGTFTCASLLGATGGRMLGLQKLGLGTLTLSGANTYTGATRITSGTLSVASLANGGAASPLGASSNAANRLVFDGGTLSYTGPTASTDRRFTINAGKTATFDVTQAGTTLTFASIIGSSLPNGTTLTKNGPGALVFGLDGKTTDANWGYLGGVDCLTVNEGYFGNVANDTPQINVSRQAASGPALVLGDGAYLACSVPVEVLSPNTEQIIRYIGTNATATIAAGLFSGPGTGGSNTKTFDVNDGAAEIDLLASASFSIYTPTGTATSDVVKAGAGTLKLSGTGSQYRGTVTVRNGRLVVGGHVPAGGGSVLGNAASVVQVGDAGTAPSNSVALVFDGPYTFSRGLCVNPYGASATLGNLSTSRAVFAGALLLSNTVQLLSATAGTNVTLFSNVISGYGGVTKTGTGVVALAAANTYTGLTTVAQGVLKLTASERIADASDLRLTGGTFDAAGFSETLGQLDVDGAADLDFGSGVSVVRFSASAAQSWSGALTLRNWSGSTYGSGTDRLFVGAAANGLSQAQLAKITLSDGRKVTQLPTGEVVPIPQGTVLLAR